MMIDVHTHALPRRVINLVEKDQRFGVDVSDGRWRSVHIAPFKITEPWYSPDAKLKEMDRQKLDASVLSAAPKPLFYHDLDLEPQSLMAREVNVGLAEFCQGHEDRMRWMAQVPLSFPQEACRMLEQAKADGAVGAQLSTSANGHRLDDPRFEPFWSKVEELKLPIFLHPAYERDLPEYADFRLGPVVGLGVEVTVTLERMIYKGVFDRHPSLTIVAALGGGFFPYNAGRLRHYSKIDPCFEGLTKRDPWSYVGQIKFDCFLHDVGQIRFLIQQAKPENVLIGTDASFASLMPDPVGVLREAADGNEAVVQQIGDINARALFWR
jgi:aminocarboxymuconate-semialdehyde decarboxylase